MNAVLLDPPSPPGFVSFRHSHGGFGEFCLNSRLRLPTLDVFHAAGWLLSRGVEVSVVDSNLLGHSLEESACAVLALKPDAVFIRTACGSGEHDRRVARAIQERFSGPVRFFGPAVGAAAAQHCGPFGDALDACAGALDPDSVPIPRWDLVPYERYTHLTTQTSWGCTFSCGYCPYPVTQGGRWRAQSAARVVREFKTLRERYGVRYVLARDPVFTLNRPRTVALCKALIKEGVPLLWGCETRLDRLDDELVELMAKAGCIRVQFGVESVNRRALENMGRTPLPPAETRRKVECLKRHGMLTYAFYMIGLPGETPDTTARTIDFALGLGTNAASFSLATPFPGTRLEGWARREGFLGPSGAMLTSCLPSMRNESMGPRELSRMLAKAKDRWAELKTSAC